LREDKPPEQIAREQPQTAAPKNSPRKSGKSTALDNARSKPQRSPRKKPLAQVAGVHLTHPDRVLYPQENLNKYELAEFYEAISGWILPHVVHRPLSLVRCPQGREGQCFFQKHLTQSMPEHLRGVEVQEKGTREKYVAIHDIRGLISLVQMNVLEIHPWPARNDRLDRPDRLVFDLDPSETLSWNATVQAARDVRDRLTEFDLQSFVRTSGGKGLHVVVPLARRTEWEDLKQFAKAIADRLVEGAPDRYVSTASKARRRGKVFIDYLRNQRGATAVASYSTRARPGAPVATPIRWEELDSRLKPDKFNVRNLRQRLAALAADPWDSFFELRQAISQSMLRAAQERTRAS
jgi:bifunctional non-homologous end joining protein LigD